MIGGGEGAKGGGEGEELPVCLFCLFVCLLFQLRFWGESLFIFLFMKKIVVDC